MTRSQRNDSRKYVPWEPAEKADGDKSKYRRRKTAAAPDVCRRENQANHSNQQGGQKRELELVQVLRRRVKDMVEREEHGKPPRHDTKYPTKVKTESAHLLPNV